jgi:predicted DNA-binding transcriptional regulator AlpA
MDQKVVYTVQEIMGLLGIGRNQAYALVKKDFFPVKRIGNRIVISKKAFEHWLNSDTSTDI